MRTSADLQTFIDQHQLEATILHLTEDTPTVPDAARILGVDTDQIIKSLVFLVKDEPILVITNGTSKVDISKLAARFEVGKKRVKFAPAEKALEITGYVVGSMPPFGHRNTLTIVLDPGVMEQQTIYGGGGDVHAMVRLTPTHLHEITKAELLSVS